MEQRETYMLASLNGADGFLDLHADKLAGLVSTSLRGRLRKAIAALTAQVSDQSKGHFMAQGTSGVMKALRATLINEYLAPIAHIAAVEHSQIPAIEPLRVPRTRSVERLKGIVDGMAELAGSYAGTFIAGGMPADFITQMNRVADEMVTSKKARAQEVSRASGATRQLKRELADGRGVIKALNTLIKIALKDDKLLLESWKSVKRVRRTSTSTGYLAPSSPVEPAPVVVSITPASTTDSLEKAG